jgi:hypothetical protein
MELVQQQAALQLVVAAEMEEHSPRPEAAAVPIPKVLRGRVQARFLPSPTRRALVRKSMYRVRPCQTQRATSTRRASLDPSSLRAATRTTVLPLTSATSATSATKTRHFGITPCHVRIMPSNETEVTHLDRKPRGKVKNFSTRKIAAQICRKFRKA